MIKHPEHISATVDYQYLFLLLRHIDVKEAVINNPDVSWIYNIVFQNKYYDVKKQIRDYYSRYNFRPRKSIVTLEDHFKFGVHRPRLRRYILSVLEAKGSQMRDFIRTM